MKVNDPGHIYSLLVLDAEISCVHTLSFVKRMGEQYPGNTTRHDGTIMQECLRAMIDRCAYVNRQMPAWQTRWAARLMGWAVWLFEWRNARKKGKRIPTVYESIYGQICDLCGHVNCCESCRES